MTNVANDFNKKGWTIIDVSALKPKIESLRKEILAVANMLSEHESGIPVLNDADMVAFHLRNNKLQHLSVKHARNLKAFYSIIGESVFFDALREQLNFNYPILEVQPIIRCDMCIENQHIFYAHQDYPYNLGSENSVTIWIPLQDTTIKNGALKIVEGSHVHGIYDHSKGLIKEAETLNFRSVEVEGGKALIFSQYLVHESGHNADPNCIRFSIQMRVSDLMESNYATRGFPINALVQNKTF